MSDTYRKRDVNAMVRRVADIIKAGGDARACVVEVLNLRYVDGRFHYKGIASEDIEDIMGFLKAEWDGEKYAAPKRAHEVEHA